ncbi:unnamed protein product [Eruca vesicaria subsp. sativa]|uniref:Uncharacterized protein n=1 Tax=Eruca vesicaria subsp. sativa TaxID=29727 RepID=A0ABC8M1P7_ERUVS|nr:unnamed protein product [Eruca vesicaria subsp. sativa]
MTRRCILCTSSLSSRENMQNGCAEVASVLKYSKLMTEARGHDDIVKVVQRDLRILNDITGNLDAEKSKKVSLGQEIASIGEES